MYLFILIRSVVYEGIKTLSESKHKLDQQFEVLENVSFHHGQQNMLSKYILFMHYRQIHSLTISVAGTKDSVEVE
jgi:hypothetical protein